jgi:signal transduction histidine kinase
MSRLVADLERLEQVESGNLKLDKTPVDLLELARAVSGNFAGTLARNNLQLLTGGDSSVASLDRDRIGGVIANLISNAVKYTPAGGQIRVLVRDEEDAAVLSVEDDGPGIAEHERELIFERFYRADKSRNRDTGGTGIGLAIVKSVTAAHGGSVEARRGRERGSIFTVTLPKRITS